MRDNAAKLGNESRMRAPRLQRCSLQKKVGFTRYDNETAECLGETGR